MFHCFSGGPDEARRCLDLGAHLSFSGIVTFKGAPEVREAVELCPLDRLVETDSALPRPVPHRGRPNQPAFVTLVGETVADVNTPRWRRSPRPPGQRRPGLRPAGLMVTGGESSSDPRPAVGVKLRSRVPSTSTNGGVFGR